MIFPGMDPYLEHPQLWPGLHTRMIVCASNQLQAQIKPRYIAAIEERVYLERSERVPDIWVRRASRTRKNGRLGGVLEADEPLIVQAPAHEAHERFIAILDRHSGQKLVAVIELVSPTNKRPGPGRESYVAKQQEVLQSDAHLVEADLLRTGDHVLAAPEWVARERAGDYDYLASVNRAHGTREEFELYPRSLDQRLPKIKIPLADKDTDAVLDLQAVLATAYDDGSYDLRVRYDRPCLPSLSKDQQTWANHVVHKAMGKKRRK